MKSGIIWFKNNLRISDNLPLYKAAKNCEKLNAVYCFDPREFEETKYGFKKTGKFRAKFLLESLAELKQNLESLNIPLVIYHDKPENALPELFEKQNITDVYLQKEWTSEEASIIKAVKAKAAAIDFHENYDQFLFHPKDIPYEEASAIPRVFTEFRKKLEAKAMVRTCFAKPEKFSAENLQSVEHSALPTMETLGFSNFETDSRTAFPFKGGEEQAKKRIQDYFWESENLAKYKQTRNGLVGENYSSKLSAWLANGSISARSVYWEVKKFEKEKIKNKDTYWLIFELIWRDFFKYISLKHGNKLFKIGGILEKDLSWNSDKEHLQN